MRDPLDLSRIKRKSDDAFSIARQGSKPVLVVRVYGHNVVSHAVAMFRHLLHFLYQHRKSL